MSKLVTDSKFLMDLLFDGADPDDTPLAATIAQLKDATLTCAEMRVTVEYKTWDELRKDLDVINVALVDAWQKMLGLQNEFGDLIEKKLKE